MASIRNSCSNSRSNNNSSYSSSGIHNESAPECSCHVRAVIRTVRKDGPNKGKKFWGCRNYVSRDVDFGCGFFDWYSEPDNQTQMGDTQCKECSKKDMEKICSKNVHCLIFCEVEF
ncbi:hypothetical protein QL285_089353 [Trifolium repens]|nr:hypothetical protein QL285_089353 [Trifolium repens]